MEELSIDDPSPLLQAASDFANYPGFQNDASAVDFLNRFPLPVIINALQTKRNIPGLEGTLVVCLERIFRTRYGASLIPQYLSFAQLGLQADSQVIRCLACKIISCFLENTDGKSALAANLISEYNVYPLLLDCLIEGDERVASASMDAIKSLASFQEGMEIVFPGNPDDPTHLRNLAARNSSLGKVRVLALIVKLFSISRTVASVVHQSSLLSLLEAEVSNASDTLVTLSVLELFFELAEIQHGPEFLSSMMLLELLSSIISNKSSGSMLRSRAIMISGRLLSRDDAVLFIDETGIGAIISAIYGRLELVESQEADEYESALEALGHIGTTIRGATLLLSNSPAAVRYVVQTAFDQQGCGRQLAALHALGNISGESRSEDDIIMSADAEEKLRYLIYETASKSLKLTPSGLFLSVLQQGSEVRLAGYRVVTGLVARSWCLMEVCSKQDIISILTDAKTETTKIGMEARYKCCKAVLKAFRSSAKLINDPAFAGIASKLQEAVGMGPYLTTRARSEAQPMVMTADRI